MHHRVLLLLVLWAALNACAHAQLCSLKPVAMTVASPKDAAKLAAAALCDNAIINAVWQGNMQLAETLVVGNGTSLTVTGTSAKTAVIDGSSRVQLFDVWGQLTFVNMTLTNGHTTKFGGAIRARFASKGGHQ
jgi:nitrous oxidase accessory protein NosD